MPVTLPGEGVTGIPCVVRGRAFGHCYFGRKRRHTEKRVQRAHSGQIAISAPASPIAIAELLVHECSHQYFHLAEEFGPIQDPEDKTAYWSPVAKRYRPIGRILCAMHAFANLELFYGQCIERGFDDHGYARCCCETHRSEIAELRKALATSRGLTPVGQDLWAPLMETATC